jgi:MerR family mercuric resistance operon transcriptional regulator
VLDPGTGFTLYTPSVKEKAFLYSTELARLAGVSTDTLRHYERRGLVPRPPRSSNGYRQYPLETAERVRVVQRALAVGFSLDELARILGERDKGKAPCREVQALAQLKLADVERRIAELEALRIELQLILQDWELRLMETEPGGRANLLDSLTGVGAGPAIVPSRLNGAKSKRGKFR